MRYRHTETCFSAKPSWPHPRWRLTREEHHEPQQAQLCPQVAQGPTPSVPSSSTPRWWRWPPSGIRRCPRVSPSTKWTGETSTSGRPTAPARTHAVSRELQEQERAGEAQFKAVARGRGNDVPPLPRPFSQVTVFSGFSPFSCFCFSIYGKAH